MAWPGLVVGVIALLVSLVSLGWQIYSWQQRRKPAALVLLRQEYNAGPVDDYTGQPIEGAPPWQTFTINVTVVNRGDVTFEVDGVGLASGDSAVWAVDDDGRGPHQAVPPGESLTESFDVSRIPDELLAGPAVGLVALVSGETFASGEPEAIHSWALARIRESPESLR